MSRILILGPTILGGLIGGALGWSVTVVGCRPDTCLVSAGLVAIATAAVCAIGVGVVMVLVSRSWEEWREADDAGVAPPGPGCETSDL